MEFEAAAKFHGHICPGLAMGYRVAQVAANHFKDRSEDEELVAIVENRSCAVDAIQVVNGCTFGKGNLVFRDHGKHVYTFFKRGDKEALRISIKTLPSPMDEKQKALFDKVRAGIATENEVKQYKEGHEKRGYDVLEIPEEDMFDITTMPITPPPKAMIYQSIACEQCGEATMETRLRVKEGKMVCMPCFEGHDI